MYSVKNNLTQPQTIGEQTLPADGQIEVESVSKRERGLAERGWISINKIEPEDAEVPKEAIADSAKPSSNGNQTNVKEKK